MITKNLAIAFAVTTALFIAVTLLTAFSPAKAEQACIQQHDGRQFCGPRENVVFIGPSLTCIAVGTGMVCPPAPESAYLRRLQDSIAGRNGAPVPAQLMIQWQLCNDTGQWHDTPTCDRMFPDVRNPRPPAG
jgi:hypothetical protein